MTDRERLIDLIREAKKYTKNANSDLERNMIFAEYLLENGVIIPPCKVGDRVYEITGRKTVSVYKVRAIRAELFGLFIEWDIVEGFVWQSLSGINADEIGKTVFLTREEAERALKEREGNG